MLTRKEIRSELLAETHRERAEAEILTLANSFEPDEPLRQSFLAAAPVRQVLDGAVKRPRHPELSSNRDVTARVGISSTHKRGDPSCSVALRSPASRIEPIGGSNSTVPEARILYRALLVAKIRIDQSIALGITLRPLEVVEKCPGMEGANTSSIGDRSSEFREHFAVPLDSAHIGYATVFFFIWAIEITASALGNFNDRMVVFP